MLDLADPHWKSLYGAYRRPFDASVPLRALAHGKDVWEELWKELHHQGDVDVASYAAVVGLIGLAESIGKRDWNFYGLIAAIEVARYRPENPPLPDWLADEFGRAWQALPPMAAHDLVVESDPETVQQLLAVLALAKGLSKLGTLVAVLDPSEVEELFDERYGSEN